jgi:formylmethanofuran dehydrogenase subunit E
LAILFFEDIMLDLQTLLDLSAARHRGHLCPRQVLGVRMGQYAAELLELDLPQRDKRLVALVETDGCVVDGIAVAAGCSVGSRTMFIMDYGKTAATFVDTETQRTVRIIPHPGSRKHALDFAPNAPDKWHAQLAAYQVMPAHELLVADGVQLSISMAELISVHGLRVVCAQCGEDIINARQVQHDGRVLCRACAGDGYYCPPASSSSAAAPPRVSTTPALTISRN